MPALSIIPVQWLRLTGAVRRTSNNMSSLNAADIQVSGPPNAPTRHPDCRRDNNPRDRIFDDCDSGFFADGCFHDKVIGGRDDCD